MTFACCVPGCDENGKRMLHLFPKKQHQCEKWIIATKNFFLNAETAYQTYYKVCRKHFQQTDFKTSNLLKKNVVPSLMLPHSIIMEQDYCIGNSIFISSPVDNTLHWQANVDNRFVWNWTRATILWRTTLNWKIRWMWMLLIQMWTMPNQ